MPAISSQITRYGLIGASFELSSGRHCAIHSSRTAVISATTSLVSRLDLMVCDSSPISASSVRPASPTRPIALTTSLFRWFGSSVAWMNVFPLGNLMPKLVSVNEQPMPMIRSDFSMKWCTVFGTALPPEPSDSGWFSGNELLPPRLVVTGAPSNSANLRSCGQASAQCTPVPA